MGVKIKEFDPSAYLDNDEVIAEYLSAALEDGNPDVFLAAIGNVAKAREVANKCLEVMPDKAIPYDYYSPQLVPALVAGGEKKKADDILDTMTARSEQMLAYYATKPDGSLFEDDQRGYLVGLQSVYMAAERAGDKPRADKARGLMQQYYPQ